MLDDKYKDRSIIIHVVLALFVIVFIALTIRLNSKRKKYGKVKRYKRF